VDRVQRDVVDDTDRSKVLLDRFNRAEERAQVIALALYAKRYRLGLPVEEGFDHYYDLALQQVAGSTLRGQIEDPGQTVPILEVLEREFKVHEEWLNSAGGAKLAGHKEVQGPLFSHYNFFDAKMIWRFTSRPSTEQVYIAPDTSHEEIARVVAAHSGGNDKSNPNVKTLSFGRNVGALMGVAASKGGDKHVLNIIDKTEYLYGIDIGSLADKGISAHAATARMISLFETEYVLVASPGDPPRTLDDLATVRLKNPFKGSAITSMLGEHGHEQTQDVEAEMGTVEPETGKGARKMAETYALELLKYAHAARKAADKQSFAVMDKEPIRGEGQIASSMGAYTRDLPRRR
jgi:hypothetical protein